MSYHNWLPLHQACLRGMTETVKHFVHGGADVNVAICVGVRCKRFTPLHFAVYGNHFEIVQLLLLAGADKTLTDFYGKTPLDFVRSQEMMDLITKY